MSAPEETAETPDKADNAAAIEQKIADWAKVGLPVATVVVAAIAGVVQGPPAAVLVLAAGALLAVIAVFWASVRTLAGETPLAGADAYALGAPRAEEEQKRAVLRALKDLEFERSVGKISEEDYQALVARYRAEAKRLLRALDTDAQPRREHAEALIAKRLRREGLADASQAAYRQSAPTTKPSEALEGGNGEAAEAEAEAEVAPKAAKTKKRAKGEPAAPKAARAIEPKAPGPVKVHGNEPVEPTLISGKAKADLEAAREQEPVASPPDGDAEQRACVSCGTINDADAVFCKKCGTRQSAVEAATAPDDGEGVA